MVVEDADAGFEVSERAGMKTFSVHGAKGAYEKFDDWNSVALIALLK